MAGKIVLAALGLALLPSPAQAAETRYVQIKPMGAPTPLTVAIAARGNQLTCVSATVGAGHARNIDVYLRSSDGIDRRVARARVPRNSETGCIRGAGWTPRVIPRANARFFVRVVEDLPGPFDVVQERNVLLL